MACIYLKDGTRVQVRVKRGQKLTARDIAELETFVGDLKRAVLDRESQKNGKQQCSGTQG